MSRKYAKRELKNKFRISDKNWTLRKSVPISAERYFSIEQNYYSLFITFPIENRNRAGNFYVLSAITDVTGWNSKLSNTRRILFPL